MDFDHDLRVVSMSLERLERLEDLGHVSFPRDFRGEVQPENETEVERPLHKVEQPEGGGGG